MVRHAYQDIPSKLTYPIASYLTTNSFSALLMHYYIIRASRYLSKALSKWDVRVPTALEELLSIPCLIRRAISSVIPLTEPYVSRSQIDHHFSINFGNCRTNGLVCVLTASLGISIMARHQIIEYFNQPVELYILG